MSSTTPTSATPTVSASKPSKSLAARAGRAALLALLGFVVLFAVYTWLALTWNYSTGERAGFVQKFSKKGVISKTWEGELAMVAMPGTTPEKFYFTVSDDDVAQQINTTMGQKVALTYDQHIGVPTTFFGETQYFVKAVRRVTD
jgi:hypothetical protein